MQLWHTAIRIYSPSSSQAMQASTNASSAALGLPKISNCSGNQEANLESSTSSVP